MRVLGDACRSWLRFGAVHEEQSPCCANIACRLGPWPLAKHAKKPGDGAWQMIYVTYATTVSLMSLHRNVKLRSQHYHMQVYDSRLGLM
jgi:hypothetical protein